MKEQLTKAKDGRLNKFGYGSILILFGFLETQKYLPVHEQKAVFELALVVLTNVCQ